MDSVLINYARHFPIRKGKLRVVESLWPATIYDHQTARLATLKYGAFKLPCDLREYLQRQYYFFGTYFLEEDILSCWQEQAKTANVIFDVGANLGIFSLAALAVNPNAIVHAFEPTPETATQLQRAAELNRLCNLNVHETAVSSNTGHAKLNRCLGDRGINGGMNFIYGDARDGDPNRVSTIRLDDFCSEHRIEHIDLLKVDVQGHEKDVFIGADRLIRSGHIGLILFELNWAPDPTQPCSARDSIQLLEQYGYQFSAISGKPRWLDSGCWLYGLSDVLALKAPDNEP
jgi:FkbM family methyltransferase